ncbi:SulP family inorganic anion transporter [Subsaximicrobium wynnwilliamsii]|uniref:SulP family inorganic anion transporter n=1 Tax=Subsaximicrobium wynnwilliamsii TaxID=291179 RepID=UPI001CB8F842|nr:SulP family inorganic anion transporter [Subsaximicrobium wynnwilliamsii]
MANKFYDFKNLKGDLYGGVVAGVVALPLALAFAFGVQSGLGAIAGLYGAIILGILAALLGGTATQASGPTGPMTIVSAAVVTLAASKFGGLETALPIILLTFFLSWDSISVCTLYGKGWRFGRRTSRNQIYGRHST